MADKNNNKWIIISLVYIGILAVVLIAVTINSCSNEKERADYTEAVFASQQADIQTEAVSETEQDTGSTKEALGAEQEAENISETEQDTENMHIEETSMPLDSDEFEEVFTTDSEGVSVAVSDTNTETVSEAETGQVEISTQYDGIVLPDDIF